MEKEGFLLCRQQQKFSLLFLLISHFVEKLFAPFRFFWRKYEKGRVAKLYDYPRRSFFPSTIFSLNSVRGSCPGNRRWFLSKKTSPITLPLVSVASQMKRRSKFNLIFAAKKFFFSICEIPNIRELFQTICKKNYKRWRAHFLQQCTVYTTYC